MTVIRTLICMALIVIGTLATHYSITMENISAEFGIWKWTTMSGLPWHALGQLKSHHAENRTCMNEQAGEQVTIAFLIGIETIN